MTSQEDSRAGLPGLGLADSQSNPARQLPHQPPTSVGDGSWPADSLSNPSKEPVLHGHD